MRIALALATAAAVGGLAATPSSAAVPCRPPVTLEACYVHDPDGSYTCTIGYVGVQLGAGTFGQACLLEWQP